MKQYATQYEKMTESPIPQLVIRLGIPTTISMLVTSVYNLVDTYFVGKLGNSASGAVGIVFSFMAILQAFGFMYGQGAGSNISRQLGAKDEKSATRYASTSFFMALLTGLCISVFGYIFLKPFIYLLGSTDTIYPYAIDYMVYMLWASPFVMSSFVLNNILRFEGKAYLAMIGLFTGAILNIIGDPIFMFVFDMGIGGAALATAISQCISFCILLSMFLSGKTQSKLSIRKVTRSLREVGDIVATGLPSLVRQGLASVSTMLLNHQAKLFGDAAVAAMSIVSRICMLIFSTGLGIGQGFQPVCGFNYGAKKYSRVREAYTFTLRMGMLILGSLAIIALLLSRYAIGIFRDDEQVIEIGTLALQLQCIAMFVQPFIVLANMTLQSTGKKLSATFTSMLRNGLYFIPVLLILSAWKGLLGIQSAQTVADFLTFLTSVPIMVHFFRHLPKGEEAVDRQSGEAEKQVEV